MSGTPDRSPPIAFASFRGFSPDWVWRDLLAGLLLAAIAIPEQIATARLAGLPPLAGLIAFIAGALAFACLGANRFLSAGADSTIAPIFAGGLAALAVTDPARYAPLAALLALMVGVILIAASLLRAGWVADLLSIPVTTGFLAGVAVHIITAQLPSLLGLAHSSGSLPAQLANIAGSLPQARLWPLAIGVMVLGVTMLAEAFWPHLPGALIAILLAAGLVAVSHLQRHLAMLAPLPSGLPRLSLPHTDLTDITRLAPLAAVIALVCMVQTATVVRAFAGPGGELAKVSPNFAGIGTGCLLAGLAGAFPVNSSPPRTAALVEAGARSQLAPLIAAACTLLLIAFGGTLLGLVPQAALAGVLIAIAVRIVRVRVMARIVRQGRSECLLVLASFVLVVALPIERGMLWAVALSLLQSISAVARPGCVELARAPGSTVWWPPAPDQPGETEPDILVFAPQAPLNFTNAVPVCRKLQALVQARPARPKLVVIEASGITGVDYTGSTLLQSAIGALRASGTEVALSRLSAARAAEEAERTGLLACIGAAQVFHSVEDAVVAHHGAGSR